MSDDLVRLLAMIILFLYRHWLALHPRRAPRQASQETERPDPPAASSPAKVDPNRAGLRNLFVSLRRRMKQEQQDPSGAADAPGDSPNAQGDGPNAQGDSPNAQGDGPNALGDSPNTQGDRPDTQNTQAGAQHNGPAAAIAPGSIGAATAAAATTERPRSTRRTRSSRCCARFAPRVRTHGAAPVLPPARARPVPARTATGPPTGPPA